MTMPATGTTAMPVRGTAPLTRTIASTGSTPAPMAAAARKPLRCRVMRRAEVYEATPSMTSTNATVSHQERTTATMIVATTASCSTARTDAVTRALESPKRPNNETATAMPTSTTSATARPQPTVTDAPLICPPAESVSRADAFPRRPP
jgi:hypothetical protein